MTSVAKCERSTTFVGWKLVVVPSVPDEGLEVVGGGGGGVVGAALALVVVCSLVTPVIIDTPVIKIGNITGDTGLV